MRLCSGNIGGTYFVESMDLPENLSRRLEALGFTKGTSVSILNRKGKGILIVKFRGSRFAFGKNISGNIEVKEFK